MLNCIIWFQFVWWSCSFVRKYRNYQKTKPDGDNPSQPGDGDDETSGSDDDDDDKKRKPEYRKPWRESTVAAPVIDSDVKIGKIFLNGCRELLNIQSNPYYEATN